MSKQDRTRRQHPRRLHGFEMFDAINLRVVPRYKTSGMSGDQWRQGVVCELMFKGEVVAERSWSSMDYAITGLGGFINESSDNGMSDEAMRLDGIKCFQPSCQNDAVSTYLLDKLTSSSGEYLADSEVQYSDSVRRFCKVHLRRGDASREDADDNYTVIDGPGPDGSVNVQESPAARVVVQVDSLDDLPAAIESVRKGKA